MMIGDIWLTEEMIPRLVHELNTDEHMIRAWMRERRLPPEIETLLDLTQNGNLAQIHNDWHGWNIDPRSGRLESPCVSYGRRLTANVGRILSIELRMQQIAVLQRDKEALNTLSTEQADRIDELERRIQDQDRVIARLETHLAEATGYKVVSLPALEARRADNHEKPIVPTQPAGSSHL